MSDSVDRGGTARVALILHQDAPGTCEQRLTRILEFFGIPATAVDARSAGASVPAGREQAFAVFGSVTTLAEALADSQSSAVLRRATAIYAYVADDGDASLRAVTRLGGGSWRRVSTGSGPVTSTISAAHPGFTGPMSGVTASVAAVAAPLVGATEAVGTTIVSAGTMPTFVGLQHEGVPLYLSGSNVPDIDAPVDHNYYDVKAHFFSAVPLVMFITATFPDAMWRARELGACLIVDDPLLRAHYGFCDFRWLRDQMRARRFTTNIAFIPWNWRRTSRRASEFFRAESHLYSVSIHGCDHVAAEFGATSPAVLDRRAGLAQARMQRHEARTRIVHDPIMVFPQGVFSSMTPGVLKRHNFIAAINTEICPSDAASRTLVRDAWDVAIVRYGSFPVYTRRYPHHGIENFAFDLLLGKPCFIVAHHGAFRDGATDLLTLIDRLHGLNAELHWRSPREVVRRAYRTRANGSANVRMYGSEIAIANPGSEPHTVEIEKQETEPSAVTSIASGGAELRRAHSGDTLRFACEIAPDSESLVSIRYASGVVPARVRQSPKQAAAVAARRLLCEFRDEVVQKVYPHVI